MDVVVSGYYGFGNTGDEALLSGLIQSLRKSAPVNVTVFSADPNETERSHGVCAIHRTNWRAMYRAVRQAHLFVSGGGGLLQDTTSFRSPYYYLGLMYGAYRVRTPVYVFANGVGPIESQFTRKVTRHVLTRALGVGVRDGASHRTLCNIGMAERDVRVTRDAAFALQWPKRTGHAGGEPNETRNTWPGPVIGVVWRSLTPFVSDEESKRLTAMVAGALMRFARHIRGCLTLIPFQPPFDDGAVKQLKRALSDVGPNDVPVRTVHERHFKDVLTTIHRMDFVFTVRYHGLVFSSITGVPAVAFAYDPKVEQLAREMAVPHVSVHAATEEELDSALHTAWHGRDTLASRMRSYADESRRIVFQEGARAIRYGRTAFHGDK